MDQSLAGSSGGGEVHLRPLSLSGILDMAISLYRNNFALFLGVVAILAVPEALLNAVVTLSGSNAALTANTTPSDSGAGVSTANLHFHPAAVAVSIGTLLIGLLFGVLITGALARVISERYLGHRSGIGQTYSSVGVGGFMVLMLASILTTLAVAASFGLVLGVAAGIIALLVVAGGSTWLFLLLIPVTVGAMFFGCVVWTHLQFVSQAVVLERKGVFDALGRSWSLVRGSAWRVFGIVIVIAIMLSVVQGIIGAVAALFFVAVSPALSTIVAGLIGIVFQPFQFGALTLLYYDLRVRNEGFDIEHLTNQMQVGPSSDWG